MLCECIYLHTAQRHSVTTVVLSRHIIINVTQNNPQKIIQHNNYQIKELTHVPLFSIETYRRNLIYLDSWVKGAGAYDEV